MIYETRYAWPYRADETHCIHGTYIGTPGGPDHICQLCEDGMTAWVKDPMYQVVIEFCYPNGTSQQMPTRIKWTLSEQLQDADTIGRCMTRVAELARQADPNVQVNVIVERKTLGYWKQP